MSPEKITISKLRASCFAVLDRVRRTGTAIIVTKHGVPIAQIVPPSENAANCSWLGSMRGSAKIVGDIVAPTS